MNNYDNKILKFFGLHKEKHWVLIFFTNFFGFFFLLSLGILSCFYTANHWSENLILVASGLLFGWFLAMLFSPYSQKDGNIFSSIFKMLSIFFSGYLVNELSKYTIDMDILKKQYITVFLFLASTLLSWLVVFSNRVYQDDSNHTPKDINPK